ncbi:ATP-dependent rRNA helicase spb4, partial [Coelomomyces lativittatus]
ELAFQIYRVVQQFLPLSPSNYPLTQSSDLETTNEPTSSPTPSLVTHALFVGGHQSPEDDISYFREHGAHLVVATPGRLHQFVQPHLRCQRMSLKECDWLILDEADKVLDVGLGPTVQQVIQQFPKQRHTGLVSATLTEHVQSLVSCLGGLRSPMYITLKVQSKQTPALLNSSEPSASFIPSQRTPSSLVMEYLVVPTAMKTRWLVCCLHHYMTTTPESKIMVFFNTCHQVVYWYTLLRQVIPHLYSLHGHQVTQRREKVYQTFVQTKDPAVLFCTDLAARGLDIPSLDYVIQFDAPTDPSLFTHRCGRAGRQGHFGQSLVFLTPQETTFIEFLQLRQVFVTPCSVDVFFSSSSSSTSMVLNQKEKEKQEKPEYVPDPLPFSWRDEILKDRKYYDLSIRAFVAYIRAYSLHTLTYIFQMNSLDWQGLIELFGLISLPKMPELRHLSLTLPSPNLSFSLDSLAYKDPVREKARLIRLEKKQQQLSSSSEVLNEKQSVFLNRKKNEIPWSKKLFERAKKRLRKEKRAKKKKNGMKSEFPVFPPSHPHAEDDPSQPSSSFPPPLESSVSEIQKKRDEAVLALFQQVEREIKQASKKKKGGQSMRIRPSDYIKDIGYQEEGPVGLTLPFSTQ